MKTKEPRCALDRMDPEAVGHAADMLRTLAHPVRLKIIDLLHTVDECPVSGITEYLDITQSATSQHLNQMRRDGLLKGERRGKAVWYSIADARPVALLNCICNCCAKNNYTLYMDGIIRDLKRYPIRLFQKPTSVRGRI